MIFSIKDQLENWVYEQRMNIAVVHMSSVFLLVIVILFSCTAIFPTGHFPLNRSTKPSILRKCAISISWVHLEFKEAAGSGFNIYDRNTTTNDLFDLVSRNIKTHRPPEFLWISVFWMQNVSCMVCVCHQWPSLFIDTAKPISWSWVDMYFFKAL